MCCCKQNVHCSNFSFIWQFLSQCVVGSSLDEQEEEEEDNESIASGFVPPKEGCYEIIATMKDPSLPKPDFVKEVIQVNIYGSIPTAVVLLVN